MGLARVRSPAVITNGGRELPQPGKRNVSITNPPPRPASASVASVASVAFASSDASATPAAAAPRRRSLLLGGGALGAVALLGGCSDGSEPRRGTDGDASAAAKLRARGVRDSVALLARYDATADAHPALAKRLAPLREETARHAAVFRGEDRAGASSAARSPAPSGSASASASADEGGTGVRAPEVPQSKKKALAALAQAERHTADTRTAALVTAPPELARLLASVAACGAAHVYLLTLRDAGS